MCTLTAEELTEIDGIGDVMAKAYVDFFHNEDNLRKIENLIEVLILDEIFEESGSNVLDGKTFVITGKVEHFDNRDKVKEAIEKAGGKTSGSVSGKTDYLINNDICLLYTSRCV